MKICYKHKNFHNKSLVIIDKANSIIDEYKKQGYQLTLRQLYYQFVSRDLIPNTQESYHKLGNIINDARLAGLIDWNAIIDRTRNLRSLVHWNNPNEIIKDAMNQYIIDKWENQKNYIEVWIEKDALIGVIENICNSFDVPFFSCRGYISQSELWNASQRIIKKNTKNKDCYILHLGDHDPSGLDMTRDIEDRMELFDAEVMVIRIALNMDQIKIYKPPPNPAKITDTRFKAYINQFGLESFELDALEPRVITELIKVNIEDLIDKNKWNETIKLENEQRKNLQFIHNNFNEIIKGQ